MKDFLETILTIKKKDLKIQKQLHPLKEVITRCNRIEKKSDAKKFKDLLMSDFRIIAEIKKASPSKGIIKNNFDPVKLAKSYEREGADAISVLTERHFFLGSSAILAAITSVVKIPVLRKDFIIDEYQIYESKILGASMVLLIAKCLTLNKLKRFIEICNDLDLEPLVEIHNEKELEKVLKTDAKIIGINNRDLRTFKTDINVSLNLIKNVPSDILCISESAIKTPSDLKIIKDAGFKGVLIGEAFMSKNNPQETLREFKSWL